MLSRVSVFAAVCIMAVSVSAAAGPHVSEYWTAEAGKMPDLWGTKVGTSKQVAFNVDRDLSVVGAAALELVVDDIDAKAEATVTFNGEKLEVADSMLGEGKGFKGRMTVAASAVKPGKNIASFTFASTLNGATTGYAIMEAYLVLMVPEDRVDPRRLRDLAPDLAEEHDLSAYSRALTGFTGLPRDAVVVEQVLPASRSRIGRRGLYMTALAQLGDGVILACANYRFEGTVWRIKAFRSNDRGATWEPMKTAGAALVGREPRLTALDDNRAIMTTWLDRNLRVYRNRDRGVTWAATDVKDGLYPARNVLAREDGSLVLFASRGTYFNRSASPSQAWVYTSGDGGATWSIESQAAVWENPEPMFDQGSLVRVGKKILACGRVTGNVAIPGVPHPSRLAPLPWMHGSSVSPNDESGDHLIVTESTDRGRTWSKPRALTGYSRVHGHLLALSDGRVLCTYAQRHLPFGVYGIISNDGGRTWAKDNPIRLAVSQDIHVAWPASIQLPDGSILTAYGTTPYLEHDDKSTTFDTVAEVVRWRLP